MTTNREADELIELLDLNVPNPVLGQIDNVTGAALVEIAKRLIALEGVYVEPKLEEPPTYITGQWYGWNGGECPVHPKSKVEVRLCNPAEEFGDMTDIADGWDWVFRGSSGIVSFRVVTPYVEPKPKLERWFNFDADGCIQGFPTKEDADKNRWDNRIRCVRMIEADDQ